MCAYRLELRTNGTKKRDQDKRQATVLTGKDEGNPRIKSHMAGRKELGGCVCDGKEICREEGAHGIY